MQSIISSKLINMCESEKQENCPCLLKWQQWESLAPVVFPSSQPLAGAGHSLAHFPPPPTDKQTTNYELRCWTLHKPATFLEY